MSFTIPSQEVIRLAAQLIYRDNPLFKLPGHSLIAWRKTVAGLCDGEHPMRQVEYWVSQGAQQAAGGEEALKALYATIGQLRAKDQEALLALAELYYHAAEQDEGPFAREEQQAVMAPLYTALAYSPAQRQEVEALKKEYLQAADRRQYSKRIVLPASVAPMTLDFLLRVASLMIINVLIWPGNEALDEVLALVFIGLKFAGISFMVILAARSRENRVNRYYERLFRNLPTLKPSAIKVRPKAWQYTLLVCMALFEGFVTYTIFRNYSTGLPTSAPSIALFQTTIVFLYLWFLLSSLSPARASAPKVLAAMADELPDFDRMSADENDAAIVKLETAFQAHKQRIDAYVIESTLFGALSFGSFLQLLASGVVEMDGIHSFVATLEEFFEHLVVFNVSGMGTVVGTLTTTPSHIFSLLAILTLMCSIMFLVVIASRLQFRRITDSLEEKLNMAQAYNQKEEQMLAQAGSATLEGERFNYLNGLIHDMLTQAFRLTRRIDPIAHFMQYFRGLGVGIFFTILIISGLFVSSLLSLLFGMLALFTALYFYGRPLLERATSVYYWLREDFLVLSSRYLLPVAIGLVIVSLSLKVLGLYHYTLWPLPTLGFGMLALIRIMKGLFTYRERPAAEGQGIIKVFDMAVFRQVGWLLAEALLYLNLYFSFFMFVPARGLINPTLFILYMGLVVDLALRNIRPKAWAWLTVVVAVALIGHLFLIAQGPQLRLQGFSVAVLVAVPLWAAVTWGVLRLRAISLRLLVLLPVLVLQFINPAAWSVVLNEGELYVPRARTLATLYENRPEASRAAEVAMLDTLGPWYAYEYLPRFRTSEAAFRLWSLVNSSRNSLGRDSVLAPILVNLSEQLVKIEPSARNYQLLLRCYIDTRELANAQAAFYKGLPLLETANGGIKPVRYYATGAQLLTLFSMDSTDWAKGLHFAKQAWEANSNFYSPYLVALLRTRAFDTLDSVAQVMVNDPKVLNREVVLADVVENYLENTGSPTVLQHGKPWAVRQVAAQPNALRPRTLLLLYHTRLEEWPEAYESAQEIWRMVDEGTYAAGARGAAWYGKLAAYYLGREAEDSTMLAYSLQRINQHKEAADTTFVFHIMRGLLHAKLGHKAWARADISIAAKQLSSGLTGESQLKKSLGNAQLLVAENRADSLEALRWFSQIYQQAPEAIVGYKPLVSLLWALGREEEARAVLEQAKPVAKANHVAWHEWPVVKCMQEE